MRLNINLVYEAAMSIEIAATTAAMSAVGAIQDAVLTLIRHLEQEKVLDYPQQRLTRLRVPYTKSPFILENLSDDECEFHFRSMDAPRA